MVAAKIFDFVSEDYPDDPLILQNKNGLITIRDFIDKFDGYSNEHKEIIIHTHRAILSGQRTGDRRVPLKSQRDPHIVFYYASGGDIPDDFRLKVSGDFVREENCRGCLSVKLKAIGFMRERQPKHSGVVREKQSSSSSIKDKRKRKEIYLKR